MRLRLRVGDAADGCSQQARVEPDDDPFTGAVALAINAPAQRTISWPGAATKYNLLHAGFPS